MAGNYAKLVLFYSKFRNCLERMRKTTKNLRTVNHQAEI
jgi:hypothetical protein